MPLFRAEFNVGLKSVATNNKFPSVATFALFVSSLGKFYDDFLAGMVAENQMAVLTFIDDMTKRMEHTCACFYACTAFGPILFLDQTHMNYAMHGIIKQIFVVACALATPCKHSWKYAEGNQPVF